MAADGILSIAAVPVAAGLTIGAVMGLTGAFLLDHSRDSGWSSERARGLAVSRCRSSPSAWRR